MFFIGATGQIITLILTFAIPLLFFVSAPAAKIQKSDVQSEIHYVSHSGDIKIRFPAPTPENSPAEITVNSVCSHHFSYDKIPTVNFPNRWKSVYPGNNENKAPPVLFA